MQRALSWLCHVMNFMGSGRRYATTLQTASSYVPIFLAYSEKKMGKPRYKANLTDKFYLHAVLSYSAVKITVYECKNLNKCMKEYASYDTAEQSCITSTYNRSIHMPF